MALLLGYGTARWPGARMCLINNKQLGALLNEHVTSRVRLDEIDTDDLVGVIIVDTGVAMNLTIKASLRTGADDNSIKIKLRLDFRLPLFAQMR